MPDLEEVGGTGFPGLTDAVHPMEQTSAEGSGGSGSGPSMLAMASLEVNDRLRDIDEDTFRPDPYAPSGVLRREGDAFGFTAVAASRRVASHRVVP